MFMVSYDAARTTYMWIDNHSKGDDDFSVPDRTNPAASRVHCRKERSPPSGAFDENPAPLLL